MDYLGHIAGVLTLFVFVPQVIKTIRSKRTKDLSFLTFFITLIGASLWVIYGISLGKSQIWFSNSVVVILSVIILGYKIKYK